MCVGLRAGRLESGGEGVDVAGDHGEAIAGLVCLADSESDDGAAITGREVLAPWLELASPILSTWELFVFGHGC